jgi:hypothetical protein
LEIRMTPNIGHNTGVAPEAQATKGTITMNVHKLPEQIEIVRRLLAAAKPRSHRRIELELQLKDLVTKRLRFECRSARRSA